MTAATAAEAASIATIVAITARTGDTSGPHQCPRPSTTASTAWTTACSDLTKADLGSVENPCKCREQRTGKSTASGHRDTFILCVRF